MARGRPRKPIEHHIATGAIYKNPNRFKARLEIAKATASDVDPPAEFLRETPANTERLEIWNELIASAEGHTKEEDKFLLEQLVYSIQSTRHGSVKISIRKSVTDMLRQWEERIRRRREVPGSSSGAGESFGEFA